MITRTNTSYSPARFGRTKSATSLVDRVLLMLSIHRERHALRHLDTHLLKDIGATEQDVQRETNRSLWDAPNRWLQR